MDGFGGQGGESGSCEAVPTLTVRFTSQRRMHTVKSTTIFLSKHRVPRLSSCDLMKSEDVSWLCRLPQATPALLHFPS